MRNKTNLELLELYKGEEFKELATKELEKRISKHARAKAGNSHFIIGFIPKTCSEDAILVKRVDGIYRFDDIANTGLIYYTDEQGNIRYMD